MGRPEYVVCVTNNSRTERQSFCGRKLLSYEYAFVSADHVVFSGINGSRLMPCPECRQVLIEALPKYEDEK